MQKLKMLFSVMTLLTNGILFANSNIGVSDFGFLTGKTPEIPNLIKPAVGATPSSDSTQLIWNSQDYTSSFHLQISISSDFSNLAVDQTGLADTSFTADALAKNTTYYWRVSASNVAGEGTFSEVWHFTTQGASSIDDNFSSPPTQFALLPAYPNPFNPTTTITYQLPEISDISLVIINSMGQTVRKLADGQHQAGEYNVLWDGRDNRGLHVTSGLYICRLAIDHHISTQKILLMR